MSRGLRNNNPGNIENSPVTWQGEVKPSKDARFKQFRTIGHGYRAMFVLLNNYQKLYRLDTIEKMITRWAPPVENDTAAYIDAVSKWSGVSPTSRITATNKDVMIPIVAAMSRMENGVPAVMNQVEEGWDLFMNQKK